MKIVLIKWLYTFDDKMVIHIQEYTSTYLKNDNNKK